MTKPFPKLVVQPNATPAPAPIPTPAAQPRTHSLFKKSIAEADTKSIVANGVFRAGTREIASNTPTSNEGSLLEDPANQLANILALLDRMVQRLSFPAMDLALRATACFLLRETWMSGMTASLEDDDTGTLAPTSV